MDKQERVEVVLKLLESGLTRDEVVTRMGLASRGSLDQSMRRRGHRWNEMRGTYTPVEGGGVSQRVQRILLEFKSVTADAKEIALRTGFADHREMAEFMRQQDFLWSAEKRNYVPKESFQQGVIQKKGVEETSPPTQHGEPVINWAEFLPLLQYLNENRGRLYSLLDMTPSRSATIPRYGVGGGHTIKSVQIATALEELVRSFNEERKISQREIFEIALIQFFYRYGYGKKVEQCLISP